MSSFHKHRGFCHCSLSSLLKLSRATAGITSCLSARCCPLMEGGSRRAAEPGMRPYTNVVSVSCSPHWGQHACNKWESTGVKTQNRSPQSTALTAQTAAGRATEHESVAAATNWAPSGSSSVANAAVHATGLRKALQGLGFPLQTSESPGKLCICLIPPGQLPDSTTKEQQKKV